MLVRLLAIACLIAAARPAAARARFDFFEPVTPPRAVQVVAHRGMKSVAPENTAEAVLNCTSDYVEWAEVDVRLTKDGKHVILHDETLERTTNGTGPVAGVTLEEFQRFDAGGWYAPRFRGTAPATLADLLAKSRGKVNLCLDCKAVNPELLVEEILAQKMAGQVVVAASPAVIARVREAGKGAIAVMAKFRPLATDFETFLQDVRPAVVEMDADDVTAEWCRRFHERGIRVEANVLGNGRDDPSTWVRMIEAGVDWIETDDPAGVRYAEVRRRVPKFPVKTAHHRGANRYAPENTLPAIRTSVALGADYVEIDIRTTKDGKFVLVHDGNLNRTSDGKGPVREMAAADIARLDAGAWFGKPFAGTRVPTLDEGLAAMGDKTGAYLDAKDITPESLLTAMRQHGLIERSVVYQSVEYLAKLRALEPRVRAMPALRSAADFDRVAATKPFAVDANWQALSRELIGRCHAAGIQVFSDALGLNESVERYGEAMDWGIDVIQTDHPLRVLRAIELRPHH